MRIVAIAFLSCLAAGIVRAEPAYVVHSGPLQSQAQSDAGSVATLPENAKVDVLRRKGAWSEVKTSEGKIGWVRMTNLRFDTQNPAPAQSSSNPLGALSSLLSSGRTSNTATVTTGVRGLSEEDLQNAHANPTELQKMQRSAVGREAAVAFAKRSRLAPANIEYLPEPHATAASPAEVY
jgi:hypothetical protein